MERRRVFRDLELSSIIDMVGLASIEPGMRNAFFREKYSNLETVIGTEGQRASNALSIAGATGIPRETVRRKLRVLLKRGFLTEKMPGRYVVTPGMIQKPEHLAALERCAREAMNFMNQCLALGLVELSEKPDDD